MIYSPRLVTKGTELQTDERTDKQMIRLLDAPADLSGRAIKIWINKVYLTNSFCKGMLLLSYSFITTPNFMCLFSEICVYKQLLFIIYIKKKDKFM